MRVSHRASRFRVSHLHSRDKRGYPPARGSRRPGTRRKRQRADNRSRRACIRRGAALRVRAVVCRPATSVSFTRAALLLLFEAALRPDKRRQVARTGPRVRAAGPRRHPSASAVACRAFSRRLDRRRSVRLPVPLSSTCAFPSGNEDCSPCSSSFAPGRAYDHGYPLSNATRRITAPLGRGAQCDERAPPFAWREQRVVACERRS
jgi:hypothetical protein